MADLTDTKKRSRDEVKNPKISSWNGPSGADKKGDVKMRPRIETTVPLIPPTSGPRQTLNSQQYTPKNGDIDLEAIQCKLEAHFGVDLSEKEDMIVDMVEDVLMERIAEVKERLQRPIDYDDDFVAQGLGNNIALEEVVDDDDDDDHDDDEGEVDEDDVVADDDDDDDVSDDEYADSDGTTRYYVWLDSDSDSSLSTSYSYPAKIVDQSNEILASIEEKHSKSNTKTDDAQDKRRRAEAERILYSVLQKTTHISPSPKSAAEKEAWKEFSGKLSEEEWKEIRMVRRKPKEKFVTCSVGSGRGSDPMRGSIGMLASFNMMLGDDLRYMVGVGDALEGAYAISDLF
ncbi:hypothetical protein HDV00_007944 [Rhizophlyctis rosea]|nr:hypothetical protein HDV00_007944 [Rhizophlyctis rosea]